MSYGKVKEILTDYQKKLVSNEFFNDEVVENINYADLSYLVLSDGVILEIDEINGLCNDTEIIEELNYPKAFLPLWIDLPKKYKKQYRINACAPDNSFPVWNKKDECVEWIPETKYLEDITPEPPYYLAWKLPDNKILYLNNTNVKYDDWYYIE